MIHLKSLQEVQKLRESADLVSRTLAEVAGHIQPGVKTIKLDEIAEKYIQGHNAKPLNAGFAL